MPYDYEKFHEVHPVDIHDESSRHIMVASLCRGQVIDVGCGTGSLADYFTGPYRGFEIASKAVEKAHEVRRPDAMFWQLDCSRGAGIDFADADTIVMCEFLEHIENDDELFEQVKKTARRGTRLIVSVPNDHNFDCDEHVRYFTIPVLREKFRKLGKVKFYNWSGAPYQIILTVEIGEFENPAVSLVMIVKNEEQGLERAILSAIDEVDEVVIAVDSASADKTRAIAEKYGDKVFSFDWSDDFARARNLADDAASYEWRIFLDGHEYFSKLDGFDFVGGTPNDGFLCDIEMENGLIFQNPRLYRKGVKFVGAVHEKQQCERIGKAPGIFIKHNRIEGQSEEAAAERARQRDDMVPRLMGAQVRENPKNTRALFHLALWAWSKKKYREQKKWSRRYLKFSECAGERWFVRFNMALGHLAANHGFRAWWEVNNAEQEMPGRWETQKLKGMILAQSGKHEQAIEFLISSFHENKNNGAYMPWRRDSAGTWNLVAECFFALHNYEKASAAWDGAREQCKDPVLKKLFEKRVSLMRDMAMEQARRASHLTN